MSVILTAIERKKGPRNRTVSEIISEQQKALTRFSLDMINKMAKYPAQQPTPYRRTGTLGRGWQARSRAFGTIDVFNQTPYAVYVEGPPTGGRGQAQTKVMRGKGWQNIVGESDKLFNTKYRQLMRESISVTRRR